MPLTKVRKSHRKALNIKKNEVVSCHGAHGMTSNEILSLIYSQNDSLPYNKKNNSITLSGITSFSKWTAGSSSIDFLAVDFISFDAERRDDNTLLISWEVLTELETEAYQINYSFDGVNYDSLTICEATNSSHYEYNWSHAPYQTIYLELVEINANDSICFLDTIVVNQIIGKNPIAWVSDKKIFTNYFPSGTINLYDSRGRLIGQNKYDISHLPRGKYYIELINEIGRWTFDFLN